MTDLIRVLLVDDAPDLTDLYRRLVDSESDMRCVGILCSAEGLLEAVHRERPAVVVLDLSMPGPDPLGAAQALAASHPESRVLAFSGYDDAQTAAAAFEAGAWGLVSKHGPPHDLLAAIRRVAAGEAAFGRSPRRPWA